MLAAALEEKSAASPTPAVLRAAAMAHRRAGDHAAAARLYRRIVESPSAQPVDRFLCAVFEDGAWQVPDLAAGTLPAPWVVLRDFLAPAERDRLLSFYLERELSFHPPKVADDERERELTFLKAPIDKDEGLRAAFDESLGDLCVRRFGDAMRGVAGRFGIATDTIEDGDLLFYLLAYRAGNAFPPHVDHTEPEGTRRLTLNAVYTFWREPRSFTGGDLLLFDTDADGTSYDAAAYTRMRPSANSLIVFPSDRYHAVTEIRSTDDTFVNGRFVLTGVLLRDV